MVSDAISSFWSNIKTKSTNPFFGTLILVWIGRNWEIIYSIFTFDSFLTRPKRIEVIQGYLMEGDFWWNLTENVLITFGIIIISYVLINLTRAITNLFENRVTPRIYELTSPSRIVQKKDYDILEASIDRLEARLVDEKKKRAELQVELDELNKKQIINEPIPTDALKLQSSKSGTEQDNERIYAYLDNGNELTNFERILEFVGKNTDISKENKLLPTFLKLNFIEVRKDYNTSASFSLTDSGKQFADYFRKRRFEQE